MIMLQIPHAARVVQVLRLLHMQKYAEMHQYSPLHGQYSPNTLFILACCL